MTAEVGSLAALDRAVSTLLSPPADELHRDIRTYLQSVVRLELPEMATGQTDPVISGVPPARSGAGIRPRGAARTTLDVRQWGFAPRAVLAPRYRAPRSHEGESAIARIRSGIASRDRECRCRPRGRQGEPSAIPTPGHRRPSVAGATTPAASRRRHAASTSRARGVGGSVHTQCRRPHRLASSRGPPACRRSREYHPAARANAGPAA